MVLSDVYGKNWISLMEQLWQELSSIYQNHGHKPWAVIGDFNTVRFLDEKKGGNKLTYAKVESINKCIDDCSLSDIRSAGSFWSWHNSSMGAKRILVRLERVLCNDVWINIMLDSRYEYQHQATSDHAHIWMQINPGISGGPKPFKFFNSWVSCTGFKDILPKVWETPITGYPLFQVAKKLKLCMLALKEWVKAGNNNVSRRADSIRVELKEISSKLKDSPFYETLHKRGNGVEV